jgi:hypothetical protein
MRRISDVSGRRRIERRAQIRHGRRQDGGNQQPAYAMRHMTDDENRKDRIRSRERGGRRIDAVKHIQHRPNHQEERELEENHHAA